MDWQTIGAFCTSFICSQESIPVTDGYGCARMCTLLVLSSSIEKTELCAACQSVRQSLHVFSGVAELVHCKFSLHAALLAPLSSASALPFALPIDHDWDSLKERKERQCFAPAWWCSTSLGRTRRQCNPRRIKLDNQHQDIQSNTQQKCNFRYAQPGSNIIRVFHPLGRSTGRYTIGSARKKRCVSNLARPCTVENYSCIWAHVLGL